ncbi:unannotated protein [freshwater metagenome]|uniref:Unannotated protein n=1 Tax=freshwater metagenome TaxID=449393 RepID=A0A6J6EJ50_9ZZZZ|nr:OmpA family protein [Actinomycetota bacterium]
MKKKPFLLVTLTTFSLLLGGVVSYAAIGPDRLVFFESEDFSLSQEQKRELDSLLPQLENASKVIVSGFVQRSRPEDRNKGPARLSHKRADAVAKYLQNLVKERSKRKQNIEWVVEGLGQPPLDPGTIFARRVEIRIEPAN